MPSATPQLPPPLVEIARGRATWPPTPGGLAGADALLAWSSDGIRLTRSGRRAYTFGALGRFALHLSLIEPPGEAPPRVVVELRAGIERFVVSALVPSDDEEAAAAVLAGIPTEAPRAIDAATDLATLASLVAAAALTGAELARAAQDRPTHGRPAAHAAESERAATASQLERAQVSGELAPIVERAVPTRALVRVWLGHRRGLAALAGLTIAMAVVGIASSLALFPVVTWVATVGALVNAFFLARSALGSLRAHHLLRHGKLGLALRTGRRAGRLNRPELPEWVLDYTLSVDPEVEPVRFSVTTEHVPVPDPDGEWVLYDPADPSAAMPLAVLPGAPMLPERNLESALVHRPLGVDDVVKAGFAAILILIILSALFA